MLVQSTTLDPHEEALTPKALPRHQPIDGFKRIALRRQRNQPLVGVEKPELTHLRLPNHAIAHNE